VKKINRFYLFCAIVGFALGVSSCGALRSIGCALCGDTIKIVNPLDADSTNAAVSADGG